MQVGGLIADDVVLHRQLLVIFHVHEVEAVGILVEKLIFAFLDRGALDLLGGLVALLGLHAVADPAHVDLRRRRSLAGKEAFGVQDDIKPPLDIKNIALADRTGDDFHVMFSTCLDGRTGRNVGRTILILMMFASPFMKSDKALRGGEK